MKRLNQSGSHIVALALAVVVVAVLGFAGYRVMQANKTTPVTTASTQPLSTPSAVPATIKTNGDLTATAKALDDTSAQVDSSLNDNSLNSDLNDLL